MIHSAAGVSASGASWYVRTRPTLLEVTIPAETQGDVLGDLHARRGRVQGTEVGEDGQQTVIALVPTAELARYAVDLRAITSGRGRIRTAHDHYDVAP